MLQLNNIQQTNFGKNSKGHLNKNCEDNKNLLFCHFRSKKLNVLFCLCSLFIVCFVCLFFLSCATQIPDIDRDNYYKSPYASNSEALEYLNKLTISDGEDYPYRRDEQYGQWTYIKETGSNTRQEVLKGQAINCETDNGKVSSGTWYICYDDDVVSYDKREDISEHVIIDHVVPVYYAHLHGAALWDQDKKFEFYNDYGQNTQFNTGNNGVNDYEKCGNLLVSSDKDDDKSAKGPSEWLPSNERCHSLYAQKWVQVLYNYGLSVTQADYDALKSILEQ